MKNKTKGIIAGVAGVALLTGGATFATWSDSATANGGQITSGNLDVASVGTPVWYDVSADRTDRTATTPVTALPGHTITPSTWRIVPGDTAEATFGFAVALQGDNLVAQLDLSAIEPLEAAGAEVSYRVFDATNTEITAGADDTVRLRGTSGAADLGGAVITRTALTGAETTADIKVVVTVDFPETIANRDGVQAVVANLGTLGVDLDQVRSGAGF